MKKIIQGICVLSFLFITPGLYAATSCDNGTCTGQIKRIYPTHDGDVYFEMYDIASASSSLSCNLLEDKFFKLEKAHPNKKEIFSLAVSLALKELNIRFRLQDSGDCIVSYIMADNL